MSPMNVEYGCGWIVQTDIKHRAAADASADAGMARRLDTMAAAHDT